jgi:hypothetical protein
VTGIVQGRADKGQRDGVTFLGHATASLLRDWLTVNPDPDRLHSCSAPGMATSSAHPL